jgi:hypothetical protein
MINNLEQLLGTKTPTAQQITDVLDDILDLLDDIQETSVVQNNEELMWEVGEAMGSVNNALDVLEEMPANNK